MSCSATSVTPPSDVSWTLSLTQYLHCESHDHAGVTGCGVPPLRDCGYDLTVVETLPVKSPEANRDH